MWCPKEHRGIDYTTSDDEQEEKDIQAAKESSKVAEKEEDRVGDSSSDDIPLIQRRDRPQTKEQPTPPIEADIIMDS